MKTAPKLKTAMKQDTYAKMPWGKYRGFFLKDVPTDYLKWCVMKYTDQGMAQWLSDELMRRPDVKKELNKVKIK